MICRGTTTLAINHVVMQMPVLAVSAVNFDVAAECAEAIYANSRYLLMPRYPHTIQGDAPGAAGKLLRAYPGAAEAVGRAAAGLVQHRCRYAGAGVGGYSQRAVQRVHLVQLCWGRWGRNEGADAWGGRRGCLRRVVRRYGRADAAGERHADLRFAVQGDDAGGEDLPDETSIAAELKTDKRLAVLTAWHKIRQYLRIDPLRDWRERNRCK